MDLSSVLITPGPNSGLWMMVLYCGDVQPLKSFVCRAAVAASDYTEIALLADVLCVSDCLAACADARWRIAGVLRR